MQEQILILSIHNQNSPSIPICCLALRYRNNEVLDSVLQTPSSHHQLDNDISSVMPVYSLVTRVSLISHFACIAAFLTVQSSGFKKALFTASKGIYSERTFHSCLFHGPTPLWMKMLVKSPPTQAQVKQCWPLVQQFCPSYLRFSFFS